MASRSGVRIARTFRFSAAHLRGQPDYALAWSVADGLTSPPSGLEFLQALSSVTGRSYKVQVIAVGDFTDSDSLVDGDGLEKLIMEWRDANLSLHPDFLSKRLCATPEMMASVLERKIQEWIGDRSVIVERVFVHESEDSYAVA